MKNSARIRVHSAAYLILQRDGQILMLRRFNTGYEDGSYSFIAGHVDAGESVSQAILREAYEEAGVTVAPKQLQFVHIMHRRCDDGLIYYDFYFVAAEWAGAIQIMEPDRCDELSWWPIDALPSNAIPYIRAAVDSIFVRREQFSEYGWETQR